MLALLLMTAQHAALTAEKVLAHGGFTIVDGSGDGQKLEAEMWTWR
jgi:hypothetical protein